MSLGKTVARRNSDINRGGELKFALDNITKYKTDMATRKSVRITGVGTPKSYNRTIVAIYPFSIAVVGATPQDYLVTMTKGLVGSSVTPGFGETTIKDYHDATPSDTAKSAMLAPEGFRAARVRTFDPTGPADYVKSKFTQLYYSKRPGTGRNYPIGRPRTGAATVDELEAKKAIRLALSSEIAQKAGRRVSFSDERGTNP